MVVFNIHKIIQSMFKDILTEVDVILLNEPEDIFPTFQNLMKMMGLL